MSSNFIENIAIVGATGNLGQPILNSLLANPRFHITAITRQQTTSLPDHARLRIAHGSYDDADFLTTALTGQDCFIIVLGHTADPDVQSRLIQAAAKAQVRWVLPTEFGSDAANEKLVAVNSAVLGKKARYREEIEALGVSAWVGIACNPLYELSLRMGAFKIDIPQRTATLYDGGSVKFNTSTFANVGRTVAALLALPIASDDPKVPALSKYRNKFAYVSSFRVNQREMLEAVQTVTGTTDADWKIDHASAQETIDRGQEDIAKGNFRAVVDVLYVSHFKEGLGGDFEGTRENVGELLDIEKEDLVEVTREVVANMK